jgi:general stress protein 26
MKDKESLFQIMNDSDAVFLSTVNGVRPRVRAMVNLRRTDLYPGAGEFCQQEGFTVYFSTSLASGKIREIQANPEVSVYYCDPKKTHGLELSGACEILSGSELRKTLWQEEWRIYWPGGAADPDYGILRLRPTQITGWWGSIPFTYPMSGA